MEEAARLQLNSARIRAEPDEHARDQHGSFGPRHRRLGGCRRRPLGVRREPPQRRRHAVSDLPISIGYRGADGATAYLNSGVNLNYFESHIPLIGARGRLAWVFTARTLPSGARPVALVGATAAPAAHPTAPMPQITADGRARGDRLEVALDNRSGVPQYQLQVYVVAHRAGHDVAAGDATVAHLGTDSSKTIELPLLGSLSRATVQVEALPTIFH